MPVRVFALFLMICLLCGLCACTADVAPPQESESIADTETVSPPESTTEPETTAEVVPETTKEIEEEPVTELLADNCRFYCVSDTKSALLMWRYKGKNIALSMRIKGVNQIFDVEKLYYNNDDTFTNDLSKYTLFITNGTDWLGPVVIKANQNADGDFPDKSHFTGGNHGADNSGKIEDNAPSGATRGLSIVIDGERREAFSGYCNEVIIRWTDYVQAANTTKMDGTGREVLKEEHTAVFDGTDSGFRITTRFIALESITFLRLYGLQSSATTKFDTVTFVGSKTGGEPQPIVPDLRGDLHTTSVRLDGPLSVEYGVTEGLADGTYQTSHAAFTSGTKCYLFLINPNAPKRCVLDTEESVYYVGWYRFE